MLSISNDAKTIKGEKQGYLTGVLYLAPHKLSGANLCPNASPECIATCLNTAGRGAFNRVQRARIAKAQRFRNDRQGFLYDLWRDINGLTAKAKRNKMTPLVRLNGTSDLPWENIPVTNASNFMALFPRVQFYDYTKSWVRMMKFLNGTMPSNYHLTFSRSECNEPQAKAILSNGGNVAVVFSTKKGQPLPKLWHRYKVIDGDIDDAARPADNFHSSNGSSSLKRNGVVIGLRAKGKARRDTTRFVVQV